MRILLICGDQSLADTLELQMKSIGMNPYTTDLGEEGIDLAKNYEYDAIVIDCDTPTDLVGADILRSIRAAKVHTPCVLFGQNGHVEKVVEILRMGADDYLPKPFHSDVLFERIKVAARRAAGLSGSTVDVGDMRVDMHNRQVTYKGKALHLTGKEYMMLELLVRRQGLTVTKENFMTFLYGGMNEPELKIIDVFACKLRKKLTAAGAGGPHAIIQTTWGRGYIIPKSQGEPAAVAA